VRLGSALAIYALFWVMSFFLVLPFGVRTAEEEGAERLPGHPESAPHSFSFGRAALRATILSGLLFGIFYLNYIYGWIGVGALDWASPPQSPQN
jgi:predicted secreted protein